MLRYVIKQNKNQQVRLLVFRCWLIRLVGTIKLPLIVSAERSSENRRSETCHVTYASSSAFLELHMPNCCRMAGSGKRQV
jgi:hypothetical protein